MGKPLISLTLLLLLVAHCGTLEKRDLSSYPPQKRTLYLHNFTNDTFQPDINLELTDLVRSEILRRENFTITDEKKEAALLVYGHLRMYRKEGQFFDNFRSAIRYRLTVICHIRLRGNPAGEMANISASGEVGASVEYSERQGYRETEYRARQRLFRMLAARISNLLELEFVAAQGP